MKKKNNVFWKKEWEKAFLIHSQDNDSLQSNSNNTNFKNSTHSITNDYEENYNIPIPHQHEPTPWQNIITDIDHHELSSKINIIMKNQSISFIFVYISILLCVSKY